MTGKHSSVIKRFLDAADNNVTWNHCFIHRQALLSKGLSENLKEVLKSVVTIVNFIKGSSLSSRIFEILCSDIEAQYTHLLYHTEGCWLSRGKVLSRVYELRTELHVLWIERNNPVALLFEDA